MKRYLINFMILCGSILLTAIVLEILFRTVFYFRDTTVREIQEAFAQTFAVPESYGIPRAHLKMDMRPYFPTGRNIPEPVIVQTNRHGMRMKEVSQEKIPEVIRVAALGDSSTFGWLVPEEASYPKLLENKLNAASKQTFEVLNFGVPGYTSYHGVQHYDRWIAPFQPDIVLLAYGYNDSYPAYFQEEEFYEILTQGNFVHGIEGWKLFWYDHSTLFSWVYQRLRNRDKAAMEKIYYERLAQNQIIPRIPLVKYKTYMIQLIEKAREQSAKVILLNLDLPNVYVREPLRELARDFNLPLLDVRQLFQDLSAEEQSQTGQFPTVLAAGIYPLLDGKQKNLLFRVHSKSELEHDEGIFLLEYYPVLTELAQPLLMFDDGTHGDEVAGDRIWTLELQSEDNQDVNYTFLRQKIDPQTGAAPMIEPIIKAFYSYYDVNLSRIAPGSLWVSPTHHLEDVPFSSMVLQGDPVHPNIRGHEMIAEHLAPMILQRAGVLE